MLLLRYRAHLTIASALLTVTACSTVDYTQAPLDEQATPVALNASALPPSRTPIDTTHEGTSDAAIPLSILGSIAIERSNAARVSVADARVAEAEQQLAGRVPRWSLSLGVGYQTEQ